MKTYAYTIEGTAADDQTWKTEGEARAVLPDTDLFQFVMRESFVKLTGGKAVFGSPGVGCNGPYVIKKITIELKE